MIYSINQNNKKGIGFTGDNSGGVILKPCSDKEELKLLVQNLKLQVQR